MKDLSENILDSRYSIGWLIEKLESEFGENASLLDWKARKVGIGQGFCSNIIVVDMKWDESRKTLPESVLLKVLNMATALKASDGLKVLKYWSAISHNNECRAYNLFKNIPDLAVPKAYFTSETNSDDSAVVVMESFADKAGFSTVVTGLSVPQVLSVVDNLAKLHAYTMNHTGWESDFDPLIEINETIIESQVKIVRELLTKFPEFDGILDPVSKYLDDTKLHTALTLETNQNLGLPAVLVQGDLWSNNLIFELKNIRVTDNLLAIVDWQTCKAGCLAEDLSRIIVTGLPTNLRKEHEDRILIFYYEKLSLYSGKTPNFGLDIVKEAYYRMFPVSFMWMVLCFHYWNHGVALEMEGGEKRENMCRILSKIKELADSLLLLEKSLKI